MSEGFDSFLGPRLEADAALRRALIEEAARSFIGGETEVALLHVRDIVVATLGIEKLTTDTAIPGPRLNAILHAGEPPRAEELARLLGALARLNGLRIEVQLEPLRAAE